MELRSTLLVLLHLAFWAQVGVVTRTFLSQFFIIGCSGQWGPCLTGGIYFSSLTPNILGSFVMGALVPPAVLGLQSKKAMSVLPSAHPWQANIPLHIGLRTGFCGSLTTFGTWQLEMMTMAIGSNQWMNTMVAYVVGMATAVVSYLVGCHTALAIDRYLSGDQEDVRGEQLAYEAEQYGLSRGSISVPSVLPREQEEEMQAAMDLPRLSHGPASKPSVQSGLPRPGTVTNLLLRGQWGQAWSGLAGNRTHVVTMLLLALFTAGWAVGAGLETSHTWLRENFFAAMFGMPGCWLRWWLAQVLNYREDSPWPWFPSGTFAANMLGTALDFGLQVAQLRAGLGYWGVLLTQSVQTGFCGALTTVSTFVAEVVKFASTFPDDFHAHTYTLQSLAGGALLGIIMYGTAYWSRG